MKDWICCDDKQQTALCCTNFDQELNRAKRHVFCLVQVIGETPVEDYPDGDSECYFSTESIDVTGIAPSSLANCGTLDITWTRFWPASLLSKITSPSFNCNSVLYRALNGCFRSRWWRSSFCKYGMLFFTFLHPSFIRLMLTFLHSSVFLM